MSTFVELVRRRASEHPDRLAYCFLVDGETQEDRLTFAELEVRSRAVAGRLREQGIRPGDRVLLLYPPGIDYLGAFFGCLFAGAIAVPAYPPRPKGPMTRLDAIARDARAAAALTTAEILDAVRSQLGASFDARTERWIATDDRDDSLADTWQRPDIGPETLAFLQYTSGSTSTPKGVMVSHGNLLANERMVEVAFEHDETSTFVGWLPIFHDMGLIGNVLHPLYLGASSILMAPIAFVQEPIRWLKAISAYEGRTSGGPNFAYDLCVVKTTPEQREGLDLSTWSLAFNGSEPVRGDTIARFVATYAPYGFRAESMYPCYGLAEATLFVSGSDKRLAPMVRSFGAAGLEQRRADPVEAGAEGARALVGCGRTWLGQEIVIADPETGERLPDGSIGEIWISGENVAGGYWNRDEQTAETFGAVLVTGEGPFLRTGDVGFFHEGELFISGRIKDLIIIRGRNHYPQDIERTVEESHAILRPGCCAAFSLEVDGEERLAVVQEVSRQFRDADLDGVVATIRRRVTDGHDLAAHAVVLIKPGRIPKTSSGKIQRALCRKLYLEGSLEPLVDSVLDQTGASDASSAAPAASLLQQTLIALGPEGGRALLESHLRERAEELGGPSIGEGGLPVLDAETLATFGKTLEADLGLRVTEELLRGAADVSALASDLVALVAEAAPAAVTETPNSNGNTTE